LNNGFEILPGWRGLLEGWKLKNSRVATARSCDACFFVQSAANPSYALGLLKFVLIIWQKEKGQK
jgi:hypothetical protein